MVTWRRFIQAASGLMDDFLMRAFTCIFLASIYTFCSTQVDAANYTLEIIQPRAGLNTLNRFYKAYPGLKFEVPISVIGGTYPFTYQLLSAPSGMTINSSTGVLSWDNPTTTGSPHTVSVRVTDSEASTDEVTWSVTVTQSGFIFVAPSSAGAADGSSCENALSFSQMYGGAAVPTEYAAKSDNTYAGYFAYFCAGSYAPTSETIYLEDGWRFAFAGAAKPLIWLAYPGTTPQFDLSGGAFSWYSGQDNLFVAGIEWHMGLNKNARLLRVPGDSNNVTFYNNVLDGDGLAGTSGGNNALLFLSGGGVTAAAPNNFAIVFNSFSDLAGVGIEGYSTNTMLVADNNAAGILGHSIYPKMGATNWFIRHNTIDQPSGNGVIVGNYVPSGNIEIAFNFISAAGTNAIFLNEQRISTSTGPYYAIRNSVIGNIRINNVESTNGPFYANYNAVQGAFDLQSINYPANLDTTNNIVAASGVIDATGALIGDYAQYSGEYGWESGASGEVEPQQTKFAPFVRMP